MSTTKAAARSKTPPVIRTAPVGTASGSADLMRVLPAWIISGVVHAVFLLLFMLVTLPSIKADATVEVKAPESLSQIEDVPPADLTNPEMGLDPAIPTNYDVERLADVSVPGIPLPSEAIGVAGAPDGPAHTVPPPPGISRGTAAGAEGGYSGSASWTDGLAGGFGGSKFMPGGFGGRSAATRDQMAEAGGGSKESEARVAMGLQWLAHHQADDGRWSLDRFHQFARDKPGLAGRRFSCNCTGQAGSANDTAGTAFGLLPFLAAGITHRSANDFAAEGRKIDYRKNVDAGLRFLMARQTREGDYGEGMYAHGLATIAMCEAYGLSSDPGLKTSAQKAINYIVYAQDPAGGGWRYGPRQGGDTSVVGWQVMALRSGQMAGLNVPGPTLKGAEKWLDSCMTSDGGGYGYIGNDETPTMSSVGLLCRQYLGWSPRNPGLLSGVAKLRKYPPGSINSMYYYYYATQVMHHMGGESWQEWNPKMRDMLIAQQDNGRMPRRPHQLGSWDPAGDAHGGSGGRVMQTSLSLLTLEVYYRHLPLYRRDSVMGAKDNKGDK
jgi:hypothetical protein